MLMDNFMMSFFTHRGQCQSIADFIRISNDLAPPTYTIFSQSIFYLIKIPCCFVDFVSTIYKYHTNDSLEL